MQFFLFTIRPKLHCRKWRKLCGALFRTFSTSPAAYWWCAVVRPTFIWKLCYTKRCNLYIHTDFWSKFCLLCWMAPCWQAVWGVIFKTWIIFGVRFEWRKVDKKQIYTKTKACKLYSRVFWIFLPNVIKIDHYNFELYRFKICAFFLRQCIYPPLA